MNECCNFETKDPMNKVPYASFDAIYYALFLNKRESVTCYRMTGELVLEKNNSLSGHIVKKFLECTQMGFPPMMGHVKGRQPDGERIPLWKRTALFPVDEVLMAMDTKERVSFPSRIKFFLLSGLFLFLVILLFCVLWDFVATDRFGAPLTLLAVITGAWVLPLSLHKSHQHYKPVCDCSMDELIA